MLARILGIVSFLLFTTIVHAQVVPDIGEYHDARGRTPVDPNIFKAAKSCIAGVSGQSILGNYSWFATPYHPWTGNYAANDGVFEFDLRSGNIYKVTSGAYPTMGMDGWFNGENINPPAPRVSVMPYIADLVVANGRCDRFLIAGHTIGGSMAYDWMPLGQFYVRSEATINKLKALGIPPNLWIEAIGWSDVNPTTPHAVDSNMTFRGYMNWKLVAGLHINDPNPAYAAQAVNAKVIMVVGSFWQGVSTVYPDRAAMIVNGQMLTALLMNNAAYTVDTSNIGLGGLVDGVHMSDGGRAFLGQAILPLIPNF